MKYGTVSKNQDALIRTGVNCGIIERTNACDNFGLMPDLNNCQYFNLCAGGYQNTFGCLDGHFWTLY